MSLCGGVRENRNENKNHKERGREKNILSGTDVETLKSGWYDFLFFVKNRWREDTSFWTCWLMFSFTNLPLLSAVPLTLSLSLPSLSLRHTHSPSPSLLLYQIEKRCFIWPATLKASPLLLYTPATNSPLHFTLLSLHWDPSKYKERGTNARRLTASWITHKWTPHGLMCPISIVLRTLHQQI